MQAMRQALRGAPRLARMACMCRSASSAPLATFALHAQPAPRQAAAAAPALPQQPSLASLEAEMLSCVLAVEREVLQAPSAHPTLLVEAVASHSERGLGAASSGSAPTLPSCPGLVALSPSACEALEHALQCWVAAQAQPLPKASLGPAASLAVRAYGLLGAHRLALALFRALHSSRTLALDPASLASCLLSAKLVGDSTAFLEVLEALEASAAAAGAAGGGAPSQPQPHHTEAGRLENLLEAIVRGSGGEGRAEPVLAALHALQWPLSLRLFTLQARAALAQRRISTAAAAMRELVRVQRSMAQEQEQALGLGQEQAQEQALQQPLAAREREEQAALAGLTVRRAIEAGNPEAACTALYALRYLAASTGAEPGGVARHVDLAWALRCSYTLGCVPLVEALAADALRHQASRSRIWEAIAREAGAGAGAGASEELVHAAVSVRVLCYLAEASALSGEDHVGALRAMALIDMHSLPFVARRGGRGGGSGSGSGSGSGRAQADFSLPEALAPLPTTMPKAVTALRKSITSFFQWEEKLEKESGRGGAGEEEAGEAAAASAGEGAVGLEAMLESEQGQEHFSSEAGPESAAHSSAEQQQQQQLEHPVAADEEPAPLGASPPTHSPSSMAAYASMASLLGLPLAPYAPSSASQQQQQQQQQREVVELQALAGGYTVTSFQARLLALASAQAHVIYSGAKVRVGALEAGSEQQQQLLQGVQQGEWGSPASGAGGAAAAPAWGEPGLAPEQQPAGELAAPPGASEASSALAAMEGAAWVAQLAQCVDAATLRATAPHPSSDPAAALPVGGGGGGGAGAGALLASPLRSLTFSAALVGQDGAWQDSAPLPEGNLRLLETLTQSLSVWVVAGRGEGSASASGSGSAPRRERAPLSPSALTAVLGATASNTRTRPQCLRILEAALERYGCLYLPLDGFACAIEALVALGTIEARREAYAQLLSSAQQQRGGKGGAGSGGGGAGGAGASAAAAAAVRAHPIDTGSVAALLQRLADRDARPNARVYAAVSHACLRAGSTAKAAAVLRHALAQGTVPPEFAFQRLLREVLSLHEAGLCPARLSDQVAPVDGALRDSSLLQLVNSGGMRGMVESVQEVVHLFNQAG